MNSEQYMVTKPMAYIRYGDSDIYKGKIDKDYSNKGYRSQHYIVKFDKFFCEIQVRTLAEEVFGEFDHRVKYPYRNDNNFLSRYANTLSKLTNAIDEMISTCFQMNESGWETNGAYFEKDVYVDWSKTLQSIIPDASGEKGLAADESESDSPINIQHYASAKLLRKENH